MDLREALGIELAREVRERKPDERLAVARHHAGVLVRGVEEKHFVDRDLVHGVALQRANPSKPRGRWHDARKPFQHLGERRRSLGGGKLALEPLDAAGKALVADRLQQVIHRLAVECLRRILVVGRHEDHVDGAVDAARKLDAGEAGHANVEKGHVRCAVVDRAKRLESIGSGWQHLELRP
jgi:hypothetical protein